MKRFFTILLPFFLAACAPGQTEGRNQGEGQLIHPAFNLDITAMEQLIKDLPDSIQNRVKARPQYFLELMDQALALPEEKLLLVDKRHALAEQYKPAGLVDLQRYHLQLNRSGLQLRQDIMPDLLAMEEAARQAGIELVISSTYRSYLTQKYIYGRNVEQYGKETADRESAQPGKSQHQLGTTIDFGSITDDFAFTPAGQWLAKHAWEYGFSLSYPQQLEWLTGYRYECWHYRHISRLGTEIQRQFFEDIQQYFLEFFHENREKLLASRIPR